MPLDKVSAQLNIDMIGRNRCDEPSEANTVYIVGSDRISTELHNLNEDANASLSTPMKLDYEMNDPADPESIYTRSDHYSYASKGIPIIFYTTGLHRDYHYVTDEVSKIEFPKMAHIAQLVYTTGWKRGEPGSFPGAGQQGTAEGKGNERSDQVDGRHTRQYNGERWGAQSAAPTAEPIRRTSEPSEPSNPSTSYPRTF